MSPYLKTATVTNEESANAIPGLTDATEQDVVVKDVACLKLNT